MAHNFKSSAMDLSKLQIHVQTEFHNALKLSQTSVLIVDESLFQSVRSAVGDLSKTPTLSQTRVLPMQSRYCTAESLKEHQNISFFSFSDSVLIQKLIAYLKSLPHAFVQRCNFNLFVSPQLQFHSEQLVKESGFKLKVMNLNVPVFVQDVDLLTLNDNSFSDQILGEQLNSKQIFDSLYLIQKLYGVFSEIFFKGKLSSNLALQLYEKTYCDLKIDKQQYPTHSQFYKLILIDRSCDPVSPLLTPVGYEPLLKEFCQANGTHYYTNPQYAFVEKPNESVFQQSNTNLNADNTQVQEKFALIDNNLTFSTDPVYSKIHSTQIGHTAEKIDQVAKSIKEFYAQKQNIREQKIAVVKDIGQQVKFFRLLETKLQLHMKFLQQILAHTNSEFYRKFDLEQALLKDHKVIDTAQVQAYINQMITLNQPLQQVLRFSCIYSLIIGGLEVNFYQKLIRNILHMYGFKYYPTLNYLASIGWLCSNKHKSFSFAQACDFFGTDQPNENAQFSSRQPISVRLIETICYSDLYQQLYNCDSDDKDLQNYLRKMLGSKAKKCTVNQGSSLLPGGETATYVLDELSTPTKHTKLNCLVCFVGGVSQAEISAIRQLNEARGEDFVQFGDKFSITILTSTILSGDSIISGFFDQGSGVKFVDDAGQLKEVQVNDTALGKETGHEVEAEGDITEQKKRKRTRRV
ncbi:Sec1_family protein [Hexamita inflata]|uniref:Sec1 family protein n=1 Tax=Hexamita inflata TaxID=28002 RepID=A0AA86UA60_9EUKA|nr:Sec1 family protein [Hexamita inflata]